MSIKKIGTIVGAAIGSFLVILVATYFVYSYLNSEDEQEFETEVERFDFAPDGYKTEKYDSLEQHIGGLQNTIDSLKEREQRQREKIDSLNNYVVELEQKEAETEKTKSEEVTAEDLKDVSRSLLNMEEGSLTPILNQLNIKQLTGLYNSANNMQRAKLLRSVNPEKAATILNEVM